MMKRILVFLALGLICLSMKSYGSTQLQANHTQLIRVALVKEDKALKQFGIAIRGEYYIFNPQSQEMLSKGRTINYAVVKLEGGKLKVGAENFSVNHLRFVSHKFMAVHLGDKTIKFRGYIDVLVKKNNRLVILNVVPIEEYVKGILYHELPSKPPAPLETMKAQAVASRTYAMYQIEENKKKDFDVTSDIYSQVYGGKSAERFRSNIAVIKTKGEVLTYKGKVLPAYFHSTCGGHTEDVRELWNQDLPPLYGVKCDYCQLAPLSNWKKNFRSSDIQNKLKTNGYHLGPIVNIRVIDRNTSGRNRNLEMTTLDGQKVIITGKKFREIIGPNEIKSNKYEIQMKGYFFDVLGKGWGHGVGMCQWGAFYMAHERFNYKEILNYYYPGARLVNLFTDAPLSAEESGF